MSKLKWLALEKASSTADSARISRRRRFNYILGFWKSREAFNPIHVIKYFTDRDRNTNKQHVEKASAALPSPSPSPQWFETQTRHANDHPVPAPRDNIAVDSYNLEPEPAFKNDVKTFSAPRRVLYGAGDEDECQGEGESPNQGQLSGQGQLHGQGQLRAQAEGDCVPLTKKEEETVELTLPRLVRWRICFLWVAVACLTYFVFSVLRTSFSNPDPIPSKPVFPRGPFGSHPSPPPSHHSKHPPDSNDQDGGCDWDCLKFLFN